MLHRITEVTPQQFWRHGYRWGWSDCKSGRPNLLDELDGQEGDLEAEIIPLPAQRSMSTTSTAGLTDGR